MPRFGVAAFSAEEEMEQFLWSMLGDQSELNLAVVRDVLIQCGYEAETALDALLDLSSSAYFFNESNNRTEAVKVEHRRAKNPWKKNVRKKQQSLKPKLDVARGDEYDAYREGAKQHWDSVTSEYQRAANAYSRGSRAYAGYISEQAKLKAKMAREADEKASQEIFKARNKGEGIEEDGVMTIDLHGQHVQQAIRLLKMHLADGAIGQSLRRLRVITGRGEERSGLRQSVIRHMQNEGIKWKEENPGAVLVKLASQRQLQVHG